MRDRNMQEWQSLINLVGGGILTALGWFCSTLWNAHKELRDDLANHRVEVAKDYVPRASLASAISDIKGSLQRIEDKLDRKVDR